jgi:GT2 family glycosyltransferase
MEHYLDNQVPTAVREVEISELQSITGLEGYKQAYVVFRYQGTVIGREWFPVIEGSIKHETLQKHCEQLAWRIWQKQHERAPLAGPGTGDVSVIVCTRDRTVDLANCLPGLQRLVPHVHEIVIVDSCPSDDSTKNLVATYPEFRYVHEPRPGLGLARNTGIGASTGEFIAFTDDDAVVEDDWIGKLLRNFSDPMVAVTTGIALPIELETAAQVWFEKTNSFVKSFDRRIFQFYYTPPLVAGITGAGVNLSIRRSALDEIGLFSVALGPGTSSGTGDDHEFLYRVLARGWKIAFDPEAIVWHKHRRDWEGLRRTIYTYGKGVYAWWTRALLKEKETTVFWYATKWFFGFQVRNLLRSAIRTSSKYPLDMAWAEFRGALAGPIGYFKARRWQQTLLGLAGNDDLLPTYYHVSQPENIHEADRFDDAAGIGFSVEKQEALFENEPAT